MLGQMPNEAGPKGEIALHYDNEIERILYTIREENQHQKAEETAGEIIDTIERLQGKEA